jgi:lipopolysaccharide/colanic/teichoic acid biosynthesis glycosyltransferase
MKSKRAFDLFVTLTAAMVWVPAMLVTALAILLLEGRPVFYVSSRVVGRGRTARVIKFRTMIRNAESVYNRHVVPVSDGVRFLNLPPDSPLYTPIGRLIERIAFTELPQLLLVLKGEMSLVGNRPLPENVMASLREAYPDVDARLDTPGGMTGPVQLIGRERLTDGQRLDLEKTYCRVAQGAVTWRLDFLILLYTVLEALRLRHPMTVGQVRDFLHETTGHPVRKSEGPPAHAEGEDA